MKEKALLTAAFVLLLVLWGWSWYWYSYGGQAAQMAGSADPEVRLQAVLKLGGKSNSLALGTLQRLCDDADLRVAVQAVRAIGGAENHANRDLLIDVLRQAGRGRIRGEACATLGNFKSADAGTLIHVLKSDADAEARAGAARGLARLRDRAALDPLLEALNDSDVKVRAVAIVAIQKVIGVRFAYEPEAPPEVRQRQVGLIRSFLNQRKPT